MPVSAYRSTVLGSGNAAGRAAQIGERGIAAYNEATVLGRCLDAPRPGPTGLEVVVAANGCSDATADVARAHSGVLVVELAEAGKARALNAGDAVVRSFPRRAHLDTAIMVDHDDLHRLVDRASADPAGGRTVPGRRRGGLPAPRPFLLRGASTVTGHGHGPVRPRADRGLRGWTGTLRRVPRARGRRPLPRRTVRGRREESGSGRRLHGASAPAHRGPVQEAGTGTTRQRRAEVRGGERCGSIRGRTLESVGLPRRGRPSARLVPAAAWYATITAPRLVARSIGGARARRSRPSRRGPRQVVRNDPPSICFHGIGVRAATRARGGRLLDRCPRRISEDPRRGDDLAEHLDLLRRRQRVRRRRRTPSAGGARSRGHLRRAGRPTGRSRGA